MATVMRTEFALDPDAPGAGVQQALLERFAHDTRRGSAEQFVAAYVLMARSLGVDARIASGFVIPEDELASATALRSDMAAVWPEVRIDGLGWVPFDPVPPEETSDVAPPAAPPRRLTPVAPQPPVVPPAQPATETPERDDAETAAADGVWTDVLRWAGRAGLALAAIAVPLAVAAGLILWLKRRRRRRLLHAPPTRAGAWGVGRRHRRPHRRRVVDRPFVDRPSGAEGGDVTVGVDDQLHQLAALSSAATFGPGIRRRPDAERPRLGSAPSNGGARPTVTVGHDCARCPSERRAHQCAARQVDQAGRPDERGRRPDGQGRRRRVRGRHGPAVRADLYDLAAEAPGPTASRSTRAARPAYRRTRSPITAAA